MFAAAKLLLLSTCLVPSILAAPPSPLSFPVGKYTPAQLRERKARADGRQKYMSSRAPANVLEVDINNDLSAPFGGEGGNSYYVNMTVGSNAQPVSLDLDTGSLVTWVFTPGACSTVTDPNLPNCGGTYDITQSSTGSVTVSGGFSVGYVDGSSATGDYVTDQVSIGGYTVNSFEFGQADAVTSFDHGLMGLSYDSSNYTSIVSALANSGIIGGRQFSLYLNDPLAAVGNIIFGGYDTDKFTGQMTVVPIAPDSSGGYSSNQVIFMSASFTNSSGTYSLPSSTLPVGSDLDCGTTTAGLPSDAFNELVATVPLYEDGNGGYAADCGASSDTVDFTLGDPSQGGSVTVSVPLYSFLGPQNGVLPDGTTPACPLAGLVSSDGAPLLGDTFLRYVYALFDHDNNVVGIATPVFNATASSTVAIDASWVSSPPSAAARPLSAAFDEL